MGLLVGPLKCLSEVRKTKTSVISKYVFTVHLALRKSWFEPGPRSNAGVWPLWLSFGGVWHLGVPSRTRQTSTLHMLVLLTISNRSMSIILGNSLVGVYQCGLSTY